MRLYPFSRRYSTDEPLPPIDLCVAAALDAVKAGITLPWGATNTSVEGTPAGISPTIDAPAEARVLTVENDVDAQPATTDPASESAIDTPSPSVSSSTDAASASSETEATLERPRRVIALSNFEKALKEITPSSSESLGTLSELRKWNDEFGEGKREKRRKLWGKGSLGVVEKGEGQGEIKVAASAGSGGGEQSPA